jgi:hypothetical protein
VFDGDGAKIIIGGDAIAQGQSTGAVIRWEESDARAERALQAKRAQVRDNVSNVVVMNVCAVGGLGEWPELITALPGSDYEKIGAVAFFEQGSVGPPEAIRREWRVLVNSKAKLPIPETLIDGLESLDQSAYSGLPRKPRLMMS